MPLTIDAHPHLFAILCKAEWPATLGELTSHVEIANLLQLDSPSPLEPDESVRATVRDLLRHGGFKPTGRSKPASEYLINAATNGKLSSINPPVDLCNIVSLHSGIPISVVDQDKLDGALRIGCAAENESYVFNLSGQEISLGGLLCLHDQHGPCANAVKDSQRTKTSDSTQRTLSILWGHRDLADRCILAANWYRELHESLEAKCMVTEASQR